MSAVAFADAGAGVDGWRNRALCVGMDTNMFFADAPEGLAGMVGMVGESAVEVCGRCPVEVECLDYAVETNQPYGIWGGKSEPQRRRLRGVWDQRSVPGQPEDELSVAFGEGRSVGQFRWDSTEG